MENLGICKDLQFVRKTLALYKWNWIIGFRFLSGAFLMLIFVSVCVCLDKVITWLPAITTPCFDFLLSMTFSLLSPALLLVPFLSLSTGIYVPRKQRPHCLLTKSTAPGTVPGTKKHIKHLLDKISQIINSFF